MSQIYAYNGKFMQPSAGKVIGKVTSASPFDILPDTEYLKEYAEMHRDHIREYQKQYHLLRKQGESNARS